MTAPAPARDQARTARRSLLVWLAACAVGGGLALLAAGRVWVTLGTAGSPAGAGGGSLTGNDLVAWLTPAALAALAAVLAVLATRGVARRATSVVVALLGAAVAAGAWDGTRGGTIAAAAAQHMTTALTSSGHISVESRPWVWPVLAAAGGLVLAVAGAAAAVLSVRWPGMSSRYERGAGRAGTGETARVKDADRAMWDAIDEGEDPTA
ncbi:Trp biosynthesis-associated membrane protein [Microbispora sp. NEAU-D428]|uniref:Trp biosynthesis-associated membrane protein n=1 Tax=Microbispora sitophila TaxID=2771537 RepID=UPI00186602C8|nr:Trp biosynthesis-associated membrane protein [Microbispora sitophila]MBE3009451.1 Trp biosynthesis-associated membrane protein [Microbispora sitophila]